MRPCAWRRHPAQPRPTRSSRSAPPSTRPGGASWPRWGCWPSRCGSPTTGWRSRPRRRCSPRPGCPLTAGSFGFPGEEGRRLVRVLAFVQDDEHGYAWAHPVDGVAAYVDLIERRVIELVDEFVLPVPQESGDYDDPAVRGPHRTTLRPIEITQPEGPSFTLEGQLLRWEGWSMRIGFDAREGLILHQISVGDGGQDRPVI